MHETSPVSPLPETAAPRGADLEQLDDEVSQVEGLNADVVVIGAGITGLTTALSLKRAGRRVVVLDARQFKNSESCRTTAHLTEVLDTRFATLLRRFGLQKTKLIIEGQRHAMDQIETWVGDIGMSCGFERLPGYLFATSEDRAQQRILDVETDAVVQLGYGDIRIRQIAAPFAVAGALRFDRQAQFRPGAYLAALESAIHGNGSLVVRGVGALGIEDAIGESPCRVSTTGGTMFAKHVVVATHVPITNHATSPIEGKLFSYRSYAIAAPVRQPLGALLWDLSNPYHHVRTVQIANRHHIVVGGGDHRVGARTDTEAVLTDLIGFARSHFGPLEVSHRWSGQIIETADGLPYVGSAGRNGASGRILIATGMSGNGFTNGTLAGLVLADAIRGVPNRWADLLAPDRRLPLASSLTRSVRRKVVAAHRRFAGHLRARSGGLAALSPRDGQVIRHNGEKLAAYRDAKGVVRALSAACPENGTTVRWNRAEKSWDCPSCGSRFNLAGSVLNGPATAALPERRLDETEGLGTSRAPAAAASASAGSASAAAPVVDSGPSLAKDAAVDERSRLALTYALVVAAIRRRMTLAPAVARASSLAPKPAHTVERG